MGEDLPDRVHVGYEARRRLLRGDPAQHVAHRGAVPRVAVVQSLQACRDAFDLVHGLFFRLHALNVVLVLYFVFLSGGQPMNEVERIAARLQRLHDGDAWHGASVRDVLGGITSEQAAARLVPDVHTIWEILAHVTAWQDEVRRRLDGGAPGEPQAGDWPAVRDTSAAAWDRALARTLRPTRRCCGRSRTSTRSVSATSSACASPRPEPASPTRSCCTVWPSTRPTSGGQIGLLKKSGERGAARRHAGVRIRRDGVSRRRRRRHGALVRGASRLRGGPVPAARAMVVRDPASRRRARSCCSASPTTANPTCAACDPAACGTPTCACAASGRSTTACRGA